MGAVFLDRDGVICKHRQNYVKSWGQFEFIPGSLEALKDLSSLKQPLIVVSNQSCIGRGLVTMEEVQDINMRMVEAVTESGGRIDEVYICPHHPDEGCQCRKPGIGMLEEAVSRYGIELAESVVVGDNKTDIEMGQKAGCSTILVRTGLGESFVAQFNTCSRHPYVVKDLAEAVDHILRQQAEEKAGVKQNG